MMRYTISRHSSKPQWSTSSDDLELARRFDRVRFLIWGKRDSKATRLSPSSWGRSAVAG